MNRCNLLAISRLVFFLGMLSVCFSVSANESPLEMTLEPLGGGQLNIELQNVSGNPLAVLRWATPFEEGLNGDYFDIRQAGDPASARLRYRGRLLKRSVPLPEDFIELAAGQAITRVVSLSTYYRIPDYADYQLMFNGTIEYRVDQQMGQQTLEQEPLQSVRLLTEPVTVQLSPAPPTSAARVDGYLSCSASQQAGLNQALQASERITNEARDALLSLTEEDARFNSPRYENWFGRYSPQRFDTVVRTYEMASSVMARGVVSFNCSCDENDLFAYVFPHLPYTVYVCPKFWSASLNGVDSRAGTILHELSHFPEVAGTTDRVYGTDGAISLASADPDLAVVNADNYEYFAENTPFLAIFNSVVFTEISVGNEVSSDLGMGESSFYKVTGANLLELTSVTGDADLYVYDSASSDGLLCRSVSASQFDSCALDPDSVAYIEVTGYSKTRFSLLARADGEEVPGEKETLIQPVVFPQGGSQESGPANSGGGGFSIWLLLLAYGWFGCLMAYRRAGCAGR